MRAVASPWPWLLLGSSILVLLAGCSGDGLQTGDTRTCPSLPQRGTIAAVEGTDLRITLYPGGDPAVLHTSGATLLRKDPDGCVSIPAAEVTTGSNVAFDVDAWAESYPMQGWPEIVVVG